VAQAEALRIQPSYNYKAFNLINTLSFGSGCRCCYDPSGDGGEYELLAAARKERPNGRVDQRLSQTAENGSGDKVNPSNDGSENSDSDDEFNYLLDEDIETTSENDLQAHRRAELENMARQYEILRFHGFGVHRQMHPQRVFPSVGYGVIDKDRYIPPGAVIHLYDAFSPLSVSLDFCLEDISSRYPGTKFVRGLGVSSIVFADDGDDDRWKNADLPMLLAIKGGKVVAFSSGLRDFSNGGDNVEPRMVEQWLDFGGVLVDTPPPVEAVCRIRPEEDMLMENMRQLRGLGKETFEGDKEGKQDRYDCGVDGCIKSFYHEHVGIKTETQDGILVSESQVTSDGEPSNIP
jgi:hypothetical protein